MPEANQAVIRQVAAQPFEKATAAFAVASAMQGSMIAGSSILLLDSIAATALILHDADHQNGGSNVAATTGRAREVSGGEISEANVPDAALRYLGSGYKELSPGRYVSSDGMRQIRFGAHETRGPLHIHFEVYEKSFFSGGSVIENSRVRIVP